MANLSLTRVNQKLHHARVMLQAVKSGADNALIESAYLEAIIFHLVCAYTHYLREIAERLGAKDAAFVKNEKDLIGSSESVKKIPVEAVELSDLRKDANSWLSQLFIAYDAGWKVPTIDPIKPSEENLITLVNLHMEPCVELSLIVVDEWYQSFLELIIRHRAVGAEY